MKADTLFNIYQSYSLAKISALNKQNLIALYAQNEQLSKLNKELAKSNSVTQQILKNQIKEIERQEKCRYYKNLAFNLSHAMGLLENEESTNFRIFACGLFLPIIQEMAKEAIQGLEEIADKEYANDIVQKCISLSEQDKALQADYQSTSWVQMLPLQERINNLSTVGIPNKEKELQLAIEEKDKKRKDDKLNAKSYKGCFITMCIVTVFILFMLIMTVVTKDFEATKGGIIVFAISIGLLVMLYRGKKKNTDAQAHNGNEALQDKIVSLENELLDLKKEELEMNSRYNGILQEITLEYPKWEKRLSEIASYLPQNKR